jgi:hypothetical protein
MKTSVALVLLIVYTRRVYGKCPHYKGRSVEALSMCYVGHRVPAPGWALSWKPCCPPHDAMEAFYSGVPGACRYD